MSVPTPEQDESNSPLIQAWRRFTRAFPDRDSGELPGLSPAWGEVPYFAWNAVMQSGVISSPDDLRARAERAAEYMSRHRVPGILILCEDWLPGQFDPDEILAPFRLKPAWKMTGMVAEELLAPLRRLPEPEFRRVADVRTLRDL